MDIFQIRDLLEEWFSPRKGRLPMSADEDYAEAEMALHARAHQAIIARFGRFPFRNAALGRASTPEEAVFLVDGGYMAEVNRQRASHAASA